MIFMIFGHYFSSQFFDAKIANELYLEKVKPGNAERGRYQPKIVNKDDQKTILNEDDFNQHFRPINISVFKLMLEPLFRVICFPLCACNTCGCKKQRRLLHIAKKRFEKEMEVTHVLKKIRDSYDILKNLQRKEYREFLKYNRKRVIDISEKQKLDCSSSENCSSSSLDSDDAEKDKVKQNLTVDDMLKMSIIRGMAIPKEQKKATLDLIKRQRA